MKTGAAQDCIVIPKRLTNHHQQAPHTTASPPSNHAFAPIGDRHDEPAPMNSANQKSPSDSSTNQEPLCNNPAKEAVLIELCKNTGYTLKQENGQRKYGGPPPGWDDPIPGKGCEIFVGKLPRDLYEDELVPVLEKCGRIYELRLMMDFNGNNRGFAFVKYCAQDEAKRALKELNNFEIRKGRLLGVCKSVDNCRLFVGGIPKTKQKDEILVEMQKVTEGVVDVIVYPSAADKTKNRGFAFVEYQDHHTAAMARRKLMHTRPQIWGHPIAVDWAEPEVEVDDDIMATVKILYVRNLMLNTTEEQLEKEFTAIVPPSAIERVKKIRDYGFIHFNTRENAIKCMKALNGKLLDGAPMEVTLAKPVDRETYVRYTRAANRVALEQSDNLANLAAYPGLIATTYDPRLDPAAAAAAAVYSYAGAPLYYGSMPYAATTIPTLPPGARYAVPSNIRGMAPIPNIGLTQIGSAGVPLGIPGASTGVAGSQGRGAGLRGRNRGIGARSIAGRNILNVGRGFQTTYYNHYKRPLWQAPPPVTSVPPGPAERFDLLPGMELIPISPHSLKPSQQQKSPTQLLEEYCKKTGMGMPEYRLHSTVGQNGRQLFLYRVALPASDSHQLQSPEASQLQEQYNQQGSPQQPPPPPQQPSSPSHSLYTPTKLSTSLEMAKEIAAEHVIAVLNIEDTSNNNCNGPDISSENDAAIYVTNDVTSSVAAMSIGSPDVNGYTTVYNGSGVEAGAYATGYQVFNGVGYAGIVSSANEVYNQY